MITPALRYGLIAAGLIAGWRWTPWAVAILMFASAVRASQVVKEERM